MQPRVLIEAQTLARGEASPHFCLPRGRLLPLPHFPAISGPLKGRAPGDHSDGPLTHAGLDSSPPRLISPPPHHLQNELLALRSSLGVCFREKPARDRPLCSICPYTTCPGSLVADRGAASPPDSAKLLPCMLASGTCQEQVGMARQSSPESRSNLRPSCLSPSPLPPFVGEASYLHGPGGPGLQVMHDISLLIFFLFFCIPAK